MGCLWIVTSRDPNQLPPNTTRRYCGKPTVRPGHCKRHLILTLEHDLRYAHKRARQGSEFHRLLIGSYEQRLAEARAL